MTELRFATSDTFNFGDAARVPGDDVEIKKEPIRFTELGGTAVGDAVTFSREREKNSDEFEQMVTILVVSAAGGLSSNERALVERIVVSLPDASGHDDKYDKNISTFPFGAYECPIEFKKGATDVDFYGRLGPLGAKPIQNETIYLY